MLSLDAYHMCFVQCLHADCAKHSYVPLNEQRVTVGGCGSSGGSCVVQASLQGLFGEAVEGELFVEVSGSHYATHPLACTALCVEAVERLCFPARQPLPWAEKNTMLLWWWWW